MNITVFWILFLGLWGIVPLMIIKGRKDENKIQNNVNRIQSTKKKGWFN